LDVVDAEWHLARCVCHYTRDFKHAAAVAAAEAAARV
jgi:hypothetical protein